MGRSALRSTAVAGRHRAAPSRSWSGWGQVTAQTIPVDPFELVVFGGTGDLAYRKLLPALFLRDRAGQVVGPSRIVAVSRRQMSDAEYWQTAREAIERHVAASEPDAAGIDSFLVRVSLVLKSVVLGNGLSVRRDFGCRRIIKQ